MEDLTTIDGIGPSTANKLIERGIDSIEALSLAEWDDIKDIHKADPQWLRDAYAMTMQAGADIPSEPEVFESQNETPGEAVPAVENRHEVIYTGGGKVMPLNPVQSLTMMSFTEDEMDVILAVANTLRRKRFARSLSPKEAVMILVNAAARDFGIA